MLKRILILTLLPLLALADDREFFGANTIATYDSSGNSVIDSEAGKSIIFKPGSDANRLFTMSAVDDLAHYIKYGDGTTASQNLLIAASTADAADSGTIYLCSGGACTANRGPFLRLDGNEGANVGHVILSSGNRAAAGLYQDAANDTGTINFRIGATVRNALQLTTGGDADNVDLVLGSASTTAPIFTIRGQTADGDDDGALRLCSGGACNDTRGPFIHMYANEAGSGGSAYYEALNSHVFRTNGGATRWTFESDGDFAQDATNGGNLIMAKAGTGFTHMSSAISAAGSTISDATLIANRVQFVEEANGAKGVKFPTTPVQGDQYVVFNRANAVLLVYPGEAGDQVNAAGAGVATSVAAYGSLFCIANGATQWWCGEMANP